MSNLSQTTEKYNVRLKKEINANLWFKKVMNDSFFKFKIVITSTKNHKLKFFKLKIGHFYGNFT